MIALERLLELCDPSSQRNAQTSQLYKSVQHMVLFGRLRTRTPSVLAKAEWKTIIRAQCSNEDLQQQDLFKALADCTVLIAERDRLLESWDVDLERSIYKRDKMERSALSLLFHLSAWKELWESDERNFYSETSVPTGGESREDGSPPFLTWFEFSNASAATMLMLYNTTLIYTVRVLASLPLRFEDAGFQCSKSTENTLEDTVILDNRQKLSSDEYLAAERLAALEVFRCVPFDSLANSRSDSRNSPICQWAIPTAWMTLGGISSAEGRWMMDLLNTNSRDAIANGVWE